RVAYLRLAIGRRRHKTAIVALDELGEAPAGQVYDLPGDDLYANGKPLRCLPDRGDCRGEVEASRIARPEKLVRCRHLPAIDRDRPVMALTLLVMGKGGRGSGRADHDVPVVEEAIPEQPHLMAALVGHEPGAV